MNPLITRDPLGGELIVTRLESQQTGIVIDGRFSLGWIGRLTPDQLDFVGLLLKNRNNLQKMASDLGVAYNTARSRLDDIVEALGGGAANTDTVTPDQRVQIIEKLEQGELGYDEALAALRGARDAPS